MMVEDTVVTSAEPAWPGVNYWPEVESEAGNSGNVLQACSGNAFMHLLPAIPSDLSS